MAKWFLGYREHNCKQYDNATGQLIIHIRCWEGEAFWRMDDNEQDIYPVICCPFYG